MQVRSWNYLPENPLESCSLQEKEWRAACGRNVEGIELEKGDNLRPFQNLGEKSEGLVFIRAEVGIMKRRRNSREIFRRKTLKDFVADRCVEDKRVGKI